MVLLSLSVALASDVLFVGNSYVLVNDLDRATRFALDQAGDDGATARLAVGGYRWSDHVARAGVAGSPWAMLLVSPQAPADWGVLQEQSQLLGLDADSEVRRSSLAAATTLDGWLAAQGAGTVLTLTWGRRDGDPDFPAEYPDYPTMQDRLTDGVLATRDALSTTERPVFVAPVGLAFRVLYDDDPDMFLTLYAADGSHPAPAGTWLAACVLAATLTGVDPRTLAAPYPMDPGVAASVADAAAQVVLEGRTGGPALTYPWTVVDSGGPPGPAPIVHTGVAETMREPGSPPRSGGCDCATGGSGASWVLGLFVAALRRRR
jgi:uncharacterized protein (TIGR03382 family)